MKLHTTIAYQGRQLIVDLAAPIDISLPMAHGTHNPTCYYAEPPVFEHITVGDFVGNTALGGVCNHFRISFAPHGNGTHTECVGHITKEKYTIHECLTQFNFLAEVVSIQPTKLANGDNVVLLDNLAKAASSWAFTPQAVVIRTLPNSDAKRLQNYSGTNPAYIEPAIGAWLAERGIEHLLLDLPSVDRESDEGKLQAHKNFWMYPHGPIRKSATITELVFVPNTCPDGTYWLQIHIASLLIDASPSKPVLYRITSH